MPKQPLNCNDVDCEFGIDLKAGPTLDEKPHFRDYHNKSLLIKTTKYTLEFTRTHTWEYECECSGCYKLETSFSRHVRDCSELEKVILEVIESQGEKVTNSYTITPRNLKRAALHQGENDYNDTLNLLLLEIKGMREDQNARSDQTEELIKAIA
ncbi:hypothetical protein BGZ76_007661, partial [Entomortierella beljakovae]